jgi:cell division protease FtsH
MSEKLGPLAYGAKEEELFLGREITKTRNFSENTAIAIDLEVKKIIMLAMKRSEKILRDDIETLHRLSNALLEREILDSDEIDRLIRGENLPPVDQRKNGEPETQGTKNTQPAQPKPEQVVDNSKPKKTA